MQNISYKSNADEIYSGIAKGRMFTEELYAHKNHKVFFLYSVNTCKCRKKTYDFYDYIHVHVYSPDIPVGSADLADGYYLEKGHF